MRSKLQWLPRLFLLLLLLSPLVASAQIGVYGTFSTAKPDFPYASRLYGSQVGAYFDAGHFILFNTGLDLRGQFFNSDSTTLDSGFIGPRVSITPHVLPIMPYAEALIGIGHARSGQGFALSDKTGFQYEFLGGVDLTVLPRIDWRVAEFGYQNMPDNSGANYHVKMLSTGLVVRLP